MPENIIESALAGKLDTVYIMKWLNNEVMEDVPEDCFLHCCNRDEFVAYFLSYLRNQTDNVLQTNTNALQVLQQNTPELIATSARKHHRSVSDPTSEGDRDSITTRRSHESPNRDKKKTGRRVKTKLFPDDKKDISASSDESRLSIGVDRIAISSTPLKNGLRISDYNLQSSPVTPHSRSFHGERCDTPRLNRHSRSSDKSVSLGDYLINAQPRSLKKKKGKNTSNEEEVNLDLSNSEIFPEIGARKSSSLRSERKRIKPTNIDRSVSQKSFSLNSFNSESFQQPSSLALEENLAFKPKIQPKENSNSFEAERNLLKQERHKLMEKFNILNTSASPKLLSTPQIKITRKDSLEKNQVYVKGDSAKVKFKEKIDILVDIYEVLIKNNLILSLHTEIYFLISLILSKQVEEDCLRAESHLNDNKVFENLLKSIHNSTYFAVKSLWNQRSILEVILDKNSLKILGENKKVRSFYPDLAKFLLNSYGLKIEAESTSDRAKVHEVRSNGIVCFNFETDNVENFPSVLSFQNFKKQRDMFYEILRWYQDTQSAGFSRTTFRGRIKTLLATGPTAANHAHLAALFTAHMLNECGAVLLQESKLSKLQRRLTCPAAPESHRLPTFSDKETFYKDFILYAENECFRVHLRDAFSSEIIALDCTPIANETSNHSDIAQEFLKVSKKLSLLSKFLGYLTSLPYSQIQVDTILKSGVLLGKKEQFATPKEKVLQNNIALRNYSQPSIDLQGLLTTAHLNGRLTLTVPWIVHYLSMLDYTTLRLNYYTKLIKTLFQIYQINSDVPRKNIIFLKSLLGYLFDLPHFPQDLYYERTDCAIDFVVSNIDECDLIEESMLFELCPFLRDVNVLLSTCKVVGEGKELGSFRHITPVSLSLNTEDRLRNKEKELQARLEEEFLKSQPSSTRRVLEVVTERVCMCAVRELAAACLPRAAARAARAARQAVRRARQADTPVHHATLLTSLQALYTQHLEDLRTSALANCNAALKQRVHSALCALLCSVPPPLLAIAVRGCSRRLDRWMKDNWNTTAVLCKDIEEQLRIFQASEPPPPSSRPPDLPHALLDGSFDTTNVSAAQCIISLKEQICTLLEYEDGVEPASLLESCAKCCSRDNLFCRPPAQRAILQLSIDYCIVFVSRKPQEVTEAWLRTLHSIWDVCCPTRRRRPALPDHSRGASLSPQLRNFEDEERAPTPVSDEDNTGFKPEVKIEYKSVPPADARETEDESLELFGRILCPRNIVLLSSGGGGGGGGGGGRAAWRALGAALVFLLGHDYLSEDCLAEQCLAVFRQDWPQNILENLSICMKSVSSQWSHAGDGKFTLFLDFLAEFCGDMDFEPEVN